MNHVISLAQCVPNSLSNAFADALFQSGPAVIDKPSRVPRSQAATLPSRDSGSTISSKNARIDAPRLSGTFVNRTQTPKRPPQSNSGPHSQTAARPLTAPVAMDSLNRISPHPGAKHLAEAGTLRVLNEPKLKKIRQYYVSRNSFTRLGYIESESTWGFQVTRRRRRRPETASPRWTWARARTRGPGTR